MEGVRSVRSLTDCEVFMNKMCDCLAQRVVIRPGQVWERRDSQPTPAGGGQEVKQQVQLGLRDYTITQHHHHHHRVNYHRSPLSLKMGCSEQQNTSC